MITVKITTRELNKHNACSEGVEYFKKISKRGVLVLVWDVETQVKYAKEASAWIGWAQDKGIVPRFSLRYADLYGADLYGANLRDADLYGADLYGANLRCANLYGANLRGADLRYADLYGADLRGANLRCADLHGADLRGADLRGADLHGADLRGADLRGAFVASTHTPPTGWINQNGVIVRG